MKSIQTLLGLGALLLASPLAFGQVVVTVDDDATNDSAYVAGSGGNLSGASALKDALLAIAGDPGQPSYEVKIIDTDGTADTYTGNLDDLNAPNLTVHQVANGKGNDAAVTIKGVDESGPGAVIVVGSTNFTLSGLSADKKMNVQAPDSGSPDIITASNGNQARPTWKYLNYVRTRDGGLLHNDFNIPNGDPHSGSQIFDHCSFNTGNGVNGPQIVANTVFNDCTTAGGGFPIVFQGGDTVMNRCTFAADCAWLHMGGTVANPKTLTMNDCIFNNNQRIYNKIGGDGDVLTINRPTFNGTGGDVAFEVSEGITININGTAANKVNLNSLGGSVIMARLTKGTFNLTDCTMTTHPGGGMLGSWDGALKGDVAFNLTRCSFDGTTGDYNAGDSAASAYKVTFTATNTIWTGTTAQGHIVTTSGSHTGADVMDFTHCTFARNTGNAFFFGGSAAKLYLEGCIVYTTAITASHVLSSVAYSTKTPHIPCITYANVPDDGSGKMFVGNPMNGTSIAAAEPVGAWDLIVDPKLAADGHQTASSPGAGFAANSTAVALDVDGEARPNPTGTYADIGADESAAVPVQLSTFQAE